MLFTNVIAVFFSYFTQLCNSRKIHYLTHEFCVKLHLKTDIALIASRFVRYRFSRAIKCGIPLSGNKFFSYKIIFIYVKHKFVWCYCRDFQVVNLISGYKKYLTLHVCPGFHTHWTHLFKFHSSGSPYILRISDSKILAKREFMSVILFLLDGSHITHSVEVNNAH